MKLELVVIPKFPMWQKVTKVGNTATVVVYRWNVHVHSIVLDYTQLSNIVFISIGKKQTLIGLHDSLLCYAASYLSFQYLCVPK